jgi:hypothetical protein
MRHISVTCQGKLGQKPKDLVGAGARNLTDALGTRHPVGWWCRVSRGARKAMQGTASAAWAPVPHLTGHPPGQRLNPPGTTATPAP